MTISIISVESQTNEDRIIEKNEVKAEPAVTENGVSVWNLLHVVTIVCTTALLLSPQMLIPRHNSIIYPTYWFKFPILVSFYMMISTTQLIGSIYFFTNQASLLNIGVFFKIYLWSAVINTVPPSIIYYFWTIVANMNHPMPLLGAISWLSSMVFQVWGIFFLLPLDLLDDEDYRRKLKVYVKYWYWWWFIHFQKDALSLVFKSLSTHFQFIITFIIVLLKEGNKRILLKLVKEMAGQDDERANVWVSISLGTHYALFITIKLAGAEDFTIFSIIAIDCLLHLAYTFKILQIQNRVATKTIDMHNTKKDKNKAINKLVLVETVEGLVPLVYALGLIMAFYGPNAKLIGNVGSGIWAYKAMENIEKVMVVLLSMFGVDVLSVFLNAYCLSKFASVNFYQYFLKFLKKYWMLLVLKLGFDLSFYFGFNDINIGMDMTTKFSWISDEGRMTFINCSNELTAEEKKYCLHPKLKFKKWSLPLRIFK